MTKRKSPQKSRKTVVKKRKKSTKSKSTMTIVLIGLILILVIALFTGVAGWIGYEAGKEKASKSYENQVEQYKNDLEKLRKKLDNTSSFLEKKEKSEPKKVSKSLDLSEIKDYVEAAEHSKKSTIRQKKSIVKKEIKTDRPKLVIIIDDVGSRAQLKAIKSLPWKITPSIFPPTRRHPNTSKLAANLQHYMIHLPMEALNYKYEEDGTLRVQSSESQIDTKVKKLRQLFPNANYINNHTGSRFTSDIISMERFFLIAKQYGFYFVDSRTTPKTVVPMVCKSFNEPYLARDIFLDNKADIGYIKNQLRKAVKIAKKHGYAIAIGHPHSITFKALASSGNILKNVDVVYIDEIYYSLSN
ncbi:divergent polysaccharide deacetylase family protein [Hydrogenimonas thermophila]|uniref:divergent polysaccharide deacetylase family protein n=1 Tax=Hydrogenimonas thermophila TaxID=223786 RepID=UPI002936DBA8|nr:divergent polysaccharide deacetylase family protein [Hydrogenimonas thermophila]WOE70941.1 divergent polysaccharide deacetylase family protein [Hydrogenimonas thermophila]WOE73459.1 divergent polysaccharide deacetylase family protein [Hydrogenimonas thermophila]